jgi:chromosome segregation ATPase
MKINEDDIKQYKNTIKTLSNRLDSVLRELSEIKAKNQNTNRIITTNNELFANNKRLEKEVDFQRDLLMTLSKALKIQLGN